MFVCILRALTRTQNTHKHVEKDELRRSRNVYERIASTVSVFLFCRLWRRSGERGCEDTSRSGRRAGRPPAPPAFPASRESGESTIRRPSRRSRVWQARGRLKQPGLKIAKAIS